MSQQRATGVGAKLRKAREKMGISLREIAETTKISSSVLDAYERDDISRVPAGVFGRAFLRTFATAVGLDGEAIVEEFVAQFPLVSVRDGYPPSEQIDDQSQGSSRAAEVAIRLNRGRSTTLLWLGAAAAIPLAALATFFGTPKRAPRWATVQSQTATNDATADELSSRPTIAKVSTPPVVQTSQSVPAAMSPPVTAMEPAPSTVPETSTPRVQTTPAAPAPVTPAPNPTSGTTPAAVAVDVAAPAPAAAQGPLKVVLSATQPSWVIATVDGKKIVNRLLEAGEQETLQASRDLIVTAGDGGAVEIALNGGTARSLGPSGKTATAHIDRATLDAYLSQTKPASASR